MSSDHRLPRLLLAVALVAGLAGAAPTAPAGAVSAPLVTTDGIGIRVDEDAVLGAPLDALEDALQPYVDQRLYDGALNAMPLTTSPNWLLAGGRLELAYDAVAAGAAGYPQGGVRVGAEVQDIEVQYLVTPVWPFADCSVWMRPDDTVATADRPIDAGLLPGTPFTPNPLASTWDNDPSVSTNGICWSYLPGTFPTPAWLDEFDPAVPGSTAADVDAEIDALVTGLLDEIWADDVVHVFDSVAALGFGVTVNQLRTDANGLIATATTDATGGVVVDGIAHDVSGAEDSGVTSNVNTVLATRGAGIDITVTLHPNVINQHLEAVTAHRGGLFDVQPVPSTIEGVLLAPADRGFYADGTWSAVFEGTDAPVARPTGTGGRPQLWFPAIDLTFRNPVFHRVATYSGSADGVRVDAAAGPPAVPAYDTGVASWNTTRTYADARATSYAPGTGASLLPWAKQALQAYADTLPPFVDLAMAGVAGFAPDLCTTCARASGDQRYSLMFEVG